MLYYLVTNKTTQIHTERSISVEKIDILKIGGRTTRVSNFISE